MPDAEKGPVMTDDVIIRRTGDVGRISLNRPKALNALNQSMVDAMIEALTAWRDDDSIKAVVVDGEGEKGFCAGGDIKMLAESGKAGDDRAWRFWRDEYRLNTLIFEYPKPYVALIDGITMGGGVGVSVHGSHRVAGDRTMIAMPETGIGFHPDVGGAYFLPRLAGCLGEWMGLTGARLKTADAIAAGVATHYVPSERNGELIYALETERLDDDGERIEELLDGFDGKAGDSDLALERGLIDAAFCEPSIEAILAALDSAGDNWSARQAELLRAKSPTSLAVTLEAIRTGRDLEFRDVMAQDLRVSMRFLRPGSDFYEGVRAVVVDKDNAPSWGPVPADRAVFFAPLDDDHEMSFI
jgi:enoyl-CoA hydratase